VSADTDYYDISISQEQAKQLARDFIADIATYAEQHRSEFEAFLKSEGYPESEVVNLAK